MRTFGICLLAMCMIFCGAVLSDNSGKQSYFIVAVIVGGIIILWALIADETIVSEE
ncbi:hypothetical protein [Hymenobacter nivis]|uniref:hypothetical protein n=1 Tax=Hymenobacter nivis TaxID=1850093 RepID=UPI0013756AD8|nr:hypothetical protein [Hymenobacter nivis]